MNSILTWWAMALIQYSEKNASQWWESAETSELKTRGWKWIDVDREIESERIERTKNPSKSMKSFRCSFIHYYTYRETYMNNVHSSIGVLLSLLLLVVVTIIIAVWVVAVSATVAAATTTTAIVVVVVVVAVAVAVTVFLLSMLCMAPVQTYFPIFISTYPYIEV